MRNVLIVFCVLTLSSCASVKEMEEARTCKVFEENKYLGVNYIDVENEVANWKGHCTIWGVFWCQWLRADFASNGVDIYIEGNGLFNQRRIVAKSNSTGFEYEKTFLEIIAKSHPVKIDMTSRKVSRDIQLTAFGMNEVTNETLSFNQSCTQKQAALGAITLWASKNRR